MRLIDADKLKEHIDKLPALPDGNFAGNHSALKALINMQPTIEPEQKWIPCSERLPEKYGNYLITTGEGEVDLGSYDPDRPGSWSACDAKGFHWVRDVVAWMPLPEPYAERREE